MPKRGVTKANATKLTKQKRAYNSTEKEKKKRAARNKARNAAIKAGKAHKGDGKDVGHVRGLAQGGSTSIKNTKMESRHGNRSKGGRIGGKRSHGGGRPKGSKNKG